MSWGPKTVFPGYSVWYEVDPLPSFVFTCDPATDYCTSAQYTPVATNVLQAQSSGTLPRGIDTFYAMSWPTYNPCQLNGVEFKLCRAAAADGTTGQVIDITDAGTGTHTFYIRNGWKDLSHPFGHSTTILGPSGSGFPSGVTFTWRTRPADGCDAAAPYGTPSAPSTYDAIGWCVKMSVASSVEPGSYTGTFQFCVLDDKTNCSTFTLEFNVMAVPTIQSSPPDWYPNISGLGVWKELMTSNATTGPMPQRGGKFWCPDPDHGITYPYPMSTWEGGVWYYDGAAVYYHIADYLHQPKWANCGDYLAKWYRDWAASGAMQKHRQFVDGLGEAAVRAQDTVGNDDGFRNAVVRMLEKSNTIASYGPRVIPSFARENAYALDLMVGLRKYFGQQHSRYEDSLSTVIGSVLSETEPSDPYGYQTFMMGLQLHSLIYAYELAPDPRILYAIQRGVDHVASHYNKKNHAPYYNTGAPNGPYCGMTKTWWNQDPGENCQKDYVGAVLNNLTAHAFAWMWRFTGKDEYRVIGDDMFKHGTLACCWTGKEFSQNYRSSFDYVRWRSAPRVRCPSGDCGEHEDRNSRSSGSRD